MRVRVEHAPHIGKLPIWSWHFVELNATRVWRLLMAKNFWRIIFNSNKKTVAVNTSNDNEQI